MASSTASRGGRAGVWFPLGNWFVIPPESRSKLVSLRNHIGRSVRRPRSTFLMALDNVETPDLQDASPTSGPTAERRKVRFPSGDTTCAAWHYPGTNGACVIMAGGTAVTKEPGTDRFAKRFHDAGFTVLAFDFRRLGESGGQPRQIVRVGEQLADWRAAVAVAPAPPGGGGAPPAGWGFSLPGGPLVPVASGPPPPAAAVPPA